MRRVRLVSPAPGRTALRAGRTALRAGRTPAVRDHAGGTTTNVPSFARVRRAAMAVCGYSAGQLRAAYGQTSENTGTGQTIALIEDGTPHDMSQTLTDYAAANGLPAPAAGQFQEDVIGDSQGCLRPVLDRGRRHDPGHRRGRQPLFETGGPDQVGFLEHGSWVDEGIPRAASGGGVSALFAQPSDQAGVVPASMASQDGVLDRAVPDVSADADRDSGILEGVIAAAGRYETFDLGGTSLACPLVAGMVADAQQGQTAPFGFIDPLLYSLAGTSAFHDILPLPASAPGIDRAAFAPQSTSGWGHAASESFDAQIPGETTQVTAPGYDTMTGLGTPNGTAFVEALRSGG